MIPDFTRQQPELLRAASRVFDSTQGRDVLVLVDGLGRDALSRSLAHAPFMRSVKDRINTLTTLVPSTTATVITSLFTGRSPLEHGVIGYQGLSSGPVTVNNLQGTAGTDPETWLLAESRRPANPTRPLAHVGPDRYASSFFTRMLQPASSWSFFGYRRLDERLDAVRAALTKTGANGLVYVHVPDVDKAGHAYGPESQEWLAALEDTDAFLRALPRVAPRGTRITVTSDHGMIAADHENVYDLAEGPQEIRKAATVGGEGRALLVRFANDPGIALETRLRVLRDWVGERGQVYGAAELLSNGMLGPATLQAREVSDRLGDALILANDRHQFTHSTWVSAASLEQRGVHGSVSREEMRIPFVQLAT